MCAAGRLVSVEGISGAGKTYLVERVQMLIGSDRVHFVSELSDRSGHGLGGGILSALRSGSDAFFRRGRPLTETFLLLALKMWDYEEVMRPHLDAGHVVVEDRSVDTIAVYQAILLESSGLGLSRWETANSLLTLAGTWRRLPDRTFLVIDDFEACVRRAERRRGMPFTSNEVQLLASAAELYEEYAATHADRIVCLDRRRRSTDEVVDSVIRDLEGPLGS